MRREIDEAAFIAAYDTYAEPIFRYCFFQVHDRDRARDLMQETFFKTWEYLVQGKRIAAIRPFLYRVAHNLCVNEYARKKPLSLDELQEHSGYDPADEQSLSPETVAEIALLMQHLSALPEKDRNILTLRYIEGLPVQEIANVLQERPNTISVRLRRATDALRGRMGDTTL